MVLSMKTRWFWLPSLLIALTYHFTSLISLSYLGEDAVSPKLWQPVIILTKLIQILQAKQHYKKSTVSKDNTEETWNRLCEAWRHQFVSALTTETTSHLALLHLETTSEVMFNSGHSSFPFLFSVLSHPESWRTWTKEVKEIQIT